MNMLTKGFTCLLMAGMAAMTSNTRVSAEQAPGAPNQVTRTIKFAQNSDGGGDTCTADISSSRTIWLNKGDAGCKNDQMTYFKLDNVRSAVRIALESRDCNDSGGWVFRLKTYIDPISTPWLSIPSLKDEPDGTIISRGLIKESGKNENQDSVKGKLSCARITVSDVP